MKRPLNKFKSGNPRQPDYDIHSISMEVMGQKHVDDSPMKEVELFTFTCNCDTEL